MMDDETVEDFFLAGLVIQSRMMRLAMGDRSSANETKRMVEEKIEAAQDGYWALATGLMTGDPACWRDPAGAFAAPGRKTLRKNAKRLTGYKSR